MLRWLVTKAQVIACNDDTEPAQVPRKRYQFVRVALPIMVTLALAVFFQNRGFDLLSKRIEDINGSLNKRIDDIGDILRAEMAKNQSELLSKLADMENRLDRRIERLEEGKWRAWPVIMASQPALS